jgi:hypothetical protein
MYVAVIYIKGTDKERNRKRQRRKKLVDKETEEEGSC